MQHEIQREADTTGLEPLEYAKFLRVGLSAADFVGGFLARALKTELKMIEARGNQFVESPLVEWKAGGDQVDVEICCPCGFNK